MGTDYFVEVDIETDAQTMADNAVARLKGQWDNWDPNDADMEVVQIEALAPMAENAALTAARVPPAIFRAYGTKLIGTPYSVGVSATSTATFTLTDTLGHVIPAGTELDIDGYAFTVDVEVTVPAGSGVASGVSIHAVDTGSAANNLTGDFISTVSSLSFVSSVVLETPTAEGTDAQSDAAYQSALSRDLLLQAKTLVTPRDFELWALSNPAVGRAYAVHKGDRLVDIVLATIDGEIVPTPAKDELQADFEQYRLTNTVITMYNPSYATINVTYTTKALPGYDHADLASRIDAMLGDILSPWSWGSPRSGDPAFTSEWVNDPIVRANFLIDRIGDVEGVAYTTSLTISSSTGSASGADWNMGSTYALPRAGTMVGTIT